jgi:hypothetical protein
MAIPHYMYITLKMSGLNRVISVKAERKHALACIEIILTSEALPKIDVGSELHPETSLARATPLRLTTTPMTNPDHVHLDALEGLTTVASRYNGPM